MEQKNKPTLSEINDDVINLWKTTFGTVFQFKSEDGKATGYFKKPDRKLLDAYTVMQKEKPVMCNEMLAKECFLGGDSILLTEDAYFFGLSQKLRILLAVKEGELTEI